MSVADFRNNVIAALLISSALIGLNQYLTFDSPYNWYFGIAAVLFAGLVTLLPHGDSRFERMSQRVGSLIRWSLYVAVSVGLLVTLILGIQHRSNAGSGTGKSQGPKTETQIVKTNPPDDSSFIERFVEVYIDGSDVAGASSRRWTYATADEQRSHLPEVDSVLRETIEREGYQPVQIFRQAFFRDGKIAEMYDADPMLLRKLAKFCDGIILGMAKHSVPPAPIPGMYATELVLQVRVLSPSQAVVRREFQVLERGSGFTKEEAESVAREHVAQSLKSQIAKETLGR